MKGKEEMNETKKWEMKGKEEIKAKKKCEMKGKEEMNEKKNRLIVEEKFRRMRCGRR